MKPKNLIVYYSRSGNTKLLAETIAHLTGATLFELVPVNTYPADDSTAIAQAEKEIRQRFHPTLKTLPEHLELYDAIFIGTPNWWNTVASPVTTFLSQCNLSGKTLIPFWTSGGNGPARIAEDIAALCPDSTMSRHFAAVSRCFNEAQITDWLQEIKCI